MPKLRNNQKKINNSWFFTIIFIKKNESLTEKSIFIRVARAEVKYFYSFSSACSPNFLVTS